MKWSLFLTVFLLWFIFFEGTSSMELTEFATDSSFFPSVSFTILRSDSSSSLGLYTMEEDRKVYLVIFPVTLLESVSSSTPIDYTDAEVQKIELSKGDEYLHYALSDNLVVYSYNGNIHALRYIDNQWYETSYSDDTILHTYNWNLIYIPSTNSNGFIILYPIYDSNQMYTLQVHYISDEVTINSVQTIVTIDALHHLPAYKQHYLFLTDLYQDGYYLNIIASNYKDTFKLDSYDKVFRIQVRVQGSFIYYTYDSSFEISFPHCRFPQFIYDAPFAIIKCGIAEKTHKIKVYSGDLRIEYASLDGGNNYSNFNMQIYSEETYSILLSEQFNFETSKRYKSVYLLLKQNSIIAAPLLEEQGLITEESSNPTEGSFIHSFESTDLPNLNSIILHIGEYTNSLVKYILCPLNSKFAEEDSLCIYCSAADSYTKGLQSSNCMTCSSSAVFYII